MSFLLLVLVMQQSSTNDIGGIYFKLVEIDNAKIISSNYEQDNWNL